MNVRSIDYHKQMPYMSYGYDQYQNYQPPYPQLQYVPVYYSPVYSQASVPQQSVYANYYSDEQLLLAYQQQIAYQNYIDMQYAQIQSSQMQLIQLQTQMVQLGMTQAALLQTPVVQAKPLTYWQVQKQKSKQKKKQKQIIKDQAKEFLKKFEPNKSEDRIKESLSEKILNSKYLQGRINKGHNSAAVDNKPKRKFDYSQDVLVNKISQFLDYIGEQPVPRGYCHGISLAWLTFMYLGLEKIFYDMIKTISNCQTNQLHTISDLILTFLDFIDVGQYPERYSNKKYSQRNVGEIIGNVGSGEFIEKDLESIFDINKMVHEHAKENVMVIVGGKSVVNGVKQRGHSLGLFKRDNQYHVFDPNYEKGEAEIFSSADAASVEIDEQIAAVTKAKNQEKFVLELYVVKDPQSLAKHEVAINDSVIASKSVFWRVPKSQFKSLPEYSSGTKRYTI